MWTLLLTSITTSFLDSLNPSAIAQQMLLQAMVNNKRYIWYFISGIGAANLALGAAIYYGVAEWVLGLISALAAREPERFYGTTLVAGLFCFLLGLWLLARATGRRKTSQEQTAGVKNPARLSPPALFCLGAVFCVVELPSALPYFAFLTVLAGFHPSFPLVLLFLMIYNFMYLLPLILLYFGYRRLEGTAVLMRIEQALGRAAAFVIPGVVTLAGGALAYYSAGYLG